MSRLWLLLFVSYSTISESFRGGQVEPFHGRRKSRDARQFAFNKIPGEDSTESLINLLTNFEESRTDKNLPQNLKISAKAAASKIRDKFLLEFESRYLVTRSSVSSLSWMDSILSLDGVETLSEEAKFIELLVMQQLAAIDVPVEDISFYNEPLTKVEETAQSFKLL